ncbi:MAG: hypothetical protein AB7L41_15820 [Flavobacteriaceae bacterium]
MKAYKAGALRESLTSVWVAAVCDLIAKYSELSANWDAAATAFIHGWDTAMAANDTRHLLKLEAKIFNASNTNQVVNPIAHTNPQCLRDDRHLYAHPDLSA